jgi:hypothetical protein
MKILLATHSFANAAGSETYLLTVALALQRLGHEIGIFTLEPGEMSELADRSGLRVADSERRLDGDYDAIVAQDGVTSHALAERFPSVPQLFVAHTVDYALQFPPQTAGVVGAVVALNDRVAKRLEALAHCPRLIRLRQPIDTRRFRPLSALPSRPASLVVLSNYLQGERLEIVRRAAGELEMSFAVVGASEGGEPTLSPEEHLHRSDVVLGCGRSALEAMACGRAVYVFGHLGVDGWVTPETYPALEQDGFAGLGSNPVADGDALRVDLANYDSAMGLANQSLAVRHHDVGSHAAELVEALRCLAPESRARSADGSLREMSRLVRVEWQTEQRALTYEHRLREAERERIEGLRELERVWGEFEKVLSGRRYRLVQALARPLDFLRRRRRRAVAAEETPGAG